MKKEEILQENGLDFTIAKQPMMTTFNGKPIETPYYGLVNSKTEEVINVVKKGYRVSQNDEIVETVLKGMQPFQNDLDVHRAASINGGRKVLIQLKLSGIQKMNDDQIEQYVTIIDSNDGSTGLSVGIGDLTISCLNAFYKFYKAGQMKFRHTISMNEKIQQLPHLIEMALNENMKQINLYKDFASTEITRHLVHSLVNEILGVYEGADLSGVTTRKLNQMNELYANIATETAEKGSNAWGLHSGVTRWTTHTKSAPKRENGRLESMVQGSNYQVNQKSLEFCKELV